MNFSLWGLRSEFISTLGDEYYNLWQFRNNESGFVNRNQEEFRVKDDQTNFLFAKDFKNSKQILFLLRHLKKQSAYRDTQKLSALRWLELNFVFLYIMIVASMIKQCINEFIIISFVTSARERLTGNFSNKIKFTKFASQNSDLSDAPLSCVALKMCLMVTYNYHSKTVLPFELVQDSCITNLSSKIFYFLQLWMGNLQCDWISVTHCSNIPVFVAKLQIFSEVLKLCLPNNFRM